jgi:uncharacterized protein
MLRSFINGERPRATGSILLFLVITGLLTWMAITLVVYVADDTSRDFQMLLGEIGLFFAVFSSTALMALIERRKTYSYGLADIRSVERFSLGAFWGIALVSLLIGSLIAIGSIRIAGRLLYGREMFSYGAAWLLVFVVVAFAEEMLYRGYLQVTLARIIGFWPAAILLSLVFGLAHLTNDHETTVAIIMTVLFGFLLCLCLRLSGSLWWGIGFHASWNWGQAFVYGTPTSGYQIHAPLLVSRGVGSSLWNGGNAGPEASLLSLPTIGIAAVVIMLAFRKRGVRSETISQC